MTFKKDYINFLLYRAIYGSNGALKSNPALKNIADKIIAIDDVVKLTYLVGKTAGLESLFKYLLYISDKIDKSQVSIFNLKDNFEYDIRNLLKICGTIAEYAPDKGAGKTEVIEEEIEEVSETVTEEETEEIESAEGMTLIENLESNTSEGDVFELDNIDETVESTGSIQEQFPEKTEDSAELTDDDEQAETVSTEMIEQPDEINAAFGDDDETEVESEPTQEIPETSVKETEPVAEEIAVEKRQAEIEAIIPEIVIEVKKPVLSDSYSDKGEPVKEESVTNEAYHKFETKFFEEVKILEKLFATINKEIKNAVPEKLTEKTLGCLTEIIEISSELSNLSRQLMFDLIADVFHTMNIYFTKAISAPGILDGDRIKLFDSSLALVNSLIKGEDYLNYDTIIDKIEKLKKHLSGAAEEEPYKEEDESVPIVQKKEAEEPIILEKQEAREPVHANDKISEESEAAVFKLKYLVKEFEKSFSGIVGFKGEYSRFEALDKVNELNNALKLIAKISSGVKMNDTLKLAEVTYVFLKYLKDYRIDLMDPEIQQIIKYIIFTFKMLLTNRRPDDFKILVQHLNNPVKIFTDS